MRVVRFGIPGIAVGVLVLLQWINSVKVSTIAYQNDGLGETMARNESLANSPPKNDTTTTKPLLILHVGPPKTGTSSIQFLARRQMNLLQQDNVYYVGNVGKQNIRNKRFSGCFDTHEDLIDKCRKHNETTCKAAWKSLDQLLKHHYAQHHIVLISEENLSDSLLLGSDLKLWNGLRFLTRNWRVEVILTYRRHYERLVSQYYQLYNPKRKLQLLTWPGKGGKEIPPFSKFAKAMAHRPYYNPAAVKKQWQEKLQLDENHVKVFNFHTRDGSFLQEFYCQMLPQAPRVCQYLKETPNITEPTKNPSSSKDLHFDMIAVAAYQEGLLHNSTLTRAQVSAAIETFAMEHFGLEEKTDFSLEHFVKKDAYELLQYSKNVESSVLSTSDNLAELTAGFQQYLTSGRLASVNATQVLEDPTWRRFFAQL